MTRLRLKIPCFACYLFLLFGLWSGSAGATATALPLPDEYILRQAGSCRIAVPQRNVGIADELMTACRETHARIYKQLGLGPQALERPVDVRVVASLEDAHQVAPPGIAVPPWSGAVAYPSLNLIILPLRNRMGGPVTEDIDIVLEHEMSHLALRTALQDAPVPRWFSEGIAIQQSEASSFRRIWLVWAAARGDSLLPLSSIDRYPDRPGRISLAYAEAADFVGFLLRQGGWLGIRVVIRKCSQGMAFEEAIAFSYQTDLKDLEQAWLAGLNSKWQWLPLITGTSALWGAMVILFIVAYIAARQRKQKRMAQMEEEEMKITQTAHPLPGNAPTPEDMPVNIGVKVGTPTKIRVDDEIHTLH
ncbi:MAG: hypothetical protein QNJ97_18290 [Myxococcota bacterium]|nr:hypothetical protein [Myxococcota bacterium]